MPTKKFVQRFTATLLLASSFLSAQSNPETARLSAFLGKWETEATFAGGNKATSSLECRWSAQGNYLVCEQTVTLGADRQYQLTVYSSNTEDKTYSFSTFSNPGATPSTGTVVITGNVWTYRGSFENNGKKTEFKTTNEFTSAKAENFKTEISNDGGSTWQTVLQGSARKVAD